MTAAADAVEITDVTQVALTIIERTRSGPLPLDSTFEALCRVAEGRRLAETDIPLVTKDMPAKCWRFTGDGTLTIDFGFMPRADRDELEPVLWNVKSEGESTLKFEHDKLFFDGGDVQLMHFEHPRSYQGAMAELKGKAESMHPNTLDALLANNSMVPTRFRRCPKGRAVTILFPEVEFTSSDGQDRFVRYMRHDGNGRWTGGWTSAQMLQPGFAIAYVEVEVEPSKDD